MLRGWTVTPCSPLSRSAGKPPRRWKCVFDPSEDGFFRGNLFTLEMIRTGGFDEGTLFENLRTGERRAWKDQSLVTL